MTFEHDDSLESGVNIKVIGVGGGGNNAVNRMISTNIRGVQFVAINTDKQALRKSSATNQLVIGEKITKGFGAGSNPDIGARAAEESIEDIKMLLSGADMVFITAGMGGGTGTGAAPIVARVAKEMNILTVGIVTKPFAFEGKKRMEQADEGIAELSQFVDSLVVIPNERLKQVSETRITLTNAFEIADDVLRRGVQSISELINVPGFINLDFADVTSIMCNAGYAHMGVGSATGKDKAELAAKAAISSPLLETSIKGARGILISITASSDVGLEDVDLACSMIANEAHPDASVIWGVAFDPELEDEIRITIIATGFEKKPEDNIMAERRLAARAERRLAQHQAAYSPAAPAAAAAPAAVGEQPNAATAEEKKSEFDTFEEAKEDEAEDDNVISDADFEEIMSILRKSKNRSSSVRN
jgi:cell division protein FtsZ